RINININLAEVPDILVDEKEICQRVLNLVRNGFEAMPAGGELSIGTFTENDEVILSVKDRGGGIADDVLEKLGTPFFTTKDNGTGLGLAACYSIAVRHGARISIETGAAGATFFVRFKQKN
ncbi:MAG: ATP-binding protein, partial [Desulfotomaculaceae bacterium]|nr:ATP-binding protein [Desulfotomaculaceae bacterium]